MTAGKEDEKTAFKKWNVRRLRATTRSEAARCEGLALAAVRRGAATKDEAVYASTYLCQYRWEDAVRAAESFGVEPPAWAMRAWRRRYRHERWA